MTDEEIESLKRILEAHPALGGMTAILDPASAWEAMATYWVRLEDRFGNTLYSFDIEVENKYREGDKEKKDDDESF